MKYFSLLIPVFAVLLALFLFQSSDRSDYFMVGDGQEQRELKELFKFLDQKDPADPSRFTIIEQITDTLTKNADTGRVNLFLTTYVASNPDDPLGAHYLFQVAESYYKQGALAFAAQYYERIIRNHPDLMVGGESLHFQCLTKLISIVEEPFARLDYFKDLTARFGDKTNSARTSYYLGRIYETLGEWDQAMKAYMTYLKFPQTTIPGDPKANQRVRSLVDLYNFDKRWIRRDLDTLMKSIKEAIGQGSITELENFRAKVGFFVLSWSYKDTFSDESENFDIRSFLWEHLRISRNVWGNTTIRFDQNLSGDSNESEAFLKTSGWNFRIPIWYLYFRKVNFPPDPEIHGGWEWAGIYLGERF